MEQGFSGEVLRATPGMLEHRRWLHRHAELSFQETETTAYLARELRALPGVTVEQPTATGLVAHLFGTKTGEPAVIGVRADIDALPISEAEGLPCISENPGVMHACGHDGHAAILLAAAQCLAASRESFCGELRMFFQHAEELPPGGAIEMVRAGAAAGVDAMLALHLSSNFPTGTFGVKSGILTANVDRFDITVRGRGGHCAFPEQCNDPIVAAAQLILALQTVVSRRLPATEPAIVSVCRIEGGTAYNIIPNEARLTAAVRSFGPEPRAAIEREVRRIAAGIAEASGTVCEVVYDEGYPSVVNDSALTALAEQTLLERFPKERVLHIGGIMPGEDFSYFLDGRPGFFLELGSGCAEKGCDAPHHNPKYRLDEDALAYGLQFELDMLRALLDGTRRAIGEGADA